MVVVAQYLGKPIYFLDCSCTDTYLIYNKRRDAFEESQIPERLVRAVHELAGPARCIFLITHRLSDSELRGPARQRDHPTQLAAFDGAMTDENYWVYRVESGAAGRPAGG